MGEVLSIVTILSFLQLGFGLWLLATAYEASFTWFLVLVGSFLMMLFGVSGPLGTLIAVGAVFSYLMTHWKEASKPALLFIGAAVIQTIVITQAARTMQEQLTEQSAVEQPR